jgi:hypothetical protein
MDYYGRELPRNFNEPADRLCRVYRSPEELFSPATMASFNLKSVTNKHPVANLDINTVEMAEKGQPTNIRREGDFLLADLVIKDALLISEIKSGNKREVSCGYDCIWVPLEDGQYEQKEICGNHVAVVPSGRAGPRVAIQDQKPEQGGKKRVGKITKELLAAMGFKAFAQDAEPEDIAKAMDAMKEDEVKDCSAKDEKPDEDKKEVKDAAEGGDSEILALLKQAIARLDKLESAEKSEVDDAKAVMDAVEKECDEFYKDGADADPDENYPEKEDKKAIKEEEKKEESKDKAHDANSMKKFVHDMAPIIMAIPDEKLRLEAANKLRATVQDARQSSKNSYGIIASKLAGNRQAAMDKNTANQPQSHMQRSINACEALAKAGKALEGGVQ